VEIRGRLSGREIARGGSSWVEICRLEESCDDDGQILQFSGTVQTTAGKLVIDAGGSLPARTRVVIKVVIGSKNKNGGANVVTQYTLAGNALPFSGSTVYVYALLAATENADFNTVALGNVPNATGQAPLSSLVTCPIQGVIALGASADVIPTQWLRPIEPLQTQQQVLIGPARMKAAQGYNDGSNPVYIMFFDTQDGSTVVNGDAPEFTIPVSGNAGNSGEADTHFSFDCITSARVFQYGMFWIVSSTSGTLTIDDTDNVRVDIELYCQQETFDLGGQP
jgi:hypothetical protein